MLSKIFMIYGIFLRFATLLSRVKQAEADVFLMNYDQSFPVFPKWSGKFFLGYPENKRIKLIDVN